MSALEKLTHLWHWTPRNAIMSTFSSLAATEVFQNLANSRVLVWRNLIYSENRNNLLISVSHRASCSDTAHHPNTIVCPTNSYCFFDYRSLFSLYQLPHSKQSDGHPWSDWRVPLCGIMGSWGWIKWITCNEHVLAQLGFSVITLNISGFVSWTIYYR